MKYQGEVNGQNMQTLGEEAKGREDVETSHEFLAKTGLESEQ